MLSEQERKLRALDPLRSQQPNSILIQIIVQILYEDQNQLCYACGKKMSTGQLHHLRYGHDITIKDLVLVHGGCHSKLHNCVNGTRGRIRKIGATLQFNH